MTKCRICQKFFVKKKLSSAKYSKCSKRSLAIILCGNHNFINVTDEDLKNIKEIVVNNRRITISEATVKKGIPYGSCD